MPERRRRDEGIKDLQPAVRALCADGLNFVQDKAAILTLERLKHDTSSGALPKRDARPTDAYRIRAGNFRGKLHRGRR